MHTIPGGVGPTGISLYLNSVHLYTNSKGILVIFGYDAPKVWNDLPDEIPSASSLASFRKKTRDTYSPKPIHHNILSVSSCCLRGVYPCYAPQLWLLPHDCLWHLRVCLMTEIKCSKSIRLDNWKLINYSYCCHALAYSCTGNPTRTGNTTRGPYSLLPYWWGTRGTMFTWVDSRIDYQLFPRVLLVQSRNNICQGCSVMALKDHYLQNNAWILMIPVLYLRSPFLMFPAFCCCWNSLGGVLVCRDNHIILIDKIVIKI